MTRRDPRPTRKRPVWALAIVVAVAAAIAAAVAGSRGDDGTSEPPATTIAPAAWRTQAEDAVKPLASSLPDYVAAVSTWNDRGRPEGDAGFTRAAAAFLRGSRQADTLAKGLPSGPGEARPLLTAATALYVDAARVHGVSVDVEGDALRREVDHLAQRLRILGDRIHDRSVNAVRAALGEPLLFEDTRPDIVLNVPDPVPDWRSLGLAPRPALSAGDAEPVPPPGDVNDETAARAGLGVLVRAEAAGAEQAATLLATSDERSATILREVGARLADLAEGSGLGPSGQPD